MAAETILAIDEFRAPRKDWGTEAGFKVRALAGLDTPAEEEA